MKFLNNIWRLVRAKRDALIEDARQAARDEAKKEVIELMKQLTRELNLGTEGE